MQEHVLASIITIIAAAVFVVILFKHLNLSPVLGYFVAGTAIGDHGLKIVSYQETALLGEFGVVFLLFAIGLELSFERLKVMRRYVFGLGSMQVIFTGIVIAASFVLFTGDNIASIIIGGGLALSSTAVVLQVIEENRSQSSQVGRISLAILLLQDFVVVPLLVIVHLLADQSQEGLAAAMGMALLKAIAALMAIFIAGRLFLRPLFSLISVENGFVSNELPIAMTLLIVLSAAFGTEHFGLSLALGAFVAGVLVAETDFRLQAEESIYPFKSLLLGLFFMNVGMKIDVLEIYTQISAVITFSIGLIILKFLIISGLCILFGFNKGVSMHAGLLLSQGGEFAFILFGLSKDGGIINENVANILFMIVTFSMALTPLLSLLGQKIAEKVDSNFDRAPLKIIELGARDLVNHVIISGFGKVGRMVARILEAEGINYIAMDLDDDIVRDEFTNGFPVFKADISQPETLKAVGAGRALAVILAMNNEITVKKALKSITASFPDLTIIVRSKDLKSSDDLYQAGATTIIPEVYETGLQLGGAALKSVGIAETEINRIKDQFRAGNYIMMKREGIFDFEND